MAKNLKKGDIIKVISGIFKNFHGSYIRLIPKGTTTKNFDIDRIKIEMYGKNTTINISAGDIRKFVPKCGCCEKILEIDWRKISSYMECDKCLKERKSGKYFHDDKMKWLKKRPESWKELDRLAAIKDI